MTREELPAQIRKNLDFHCGEWMDDGKQPADLTKFEVHYWTKESISRGSAWTKVPHVETPNDRNPWRKAHTADYWVWYRKL